MLKKIKEMLPDPTRFRIRFTRNFHRYFRDFYYDFVQYTKYSASVYPAGSKLNLQSLIIIWYHALEKGLALKNPRKDFGIKKSDVLVDYLEKYVDRYGYDTIVVISLNVLQKYREFQTSHGITRDEFAARLSVLRDNIPEPYRSEDRGGPIPVDRETIWKSAKIDFEGFAKSRYSVRQYSGDPVDDDLIKRAVTMAMKTPSVCNRQATKVYMIRDDQLRKTMLRLQMGNKGFGEDADKLLLITSELRYFVQSGERREPYIGGGMFAMSLIYALHSLGLGTCCLNLSQSCQLETKIKKAAGISDSEVLIMLIAVGHIPAELSVAASPRRDIQEILTVR